MTSPYLTIERDINTLSEQIEAYKDKKHGHSVDHRPQVSRKQEDRRHCERRMANDDLPLGVERRKTERRTYFDRRNDNTWRFSWLRKCLSVQLAN